MKANELRIGNFVFTDTNSIVPIQSSGITAFEKGFLIAQPMELTDEILLKCGFEGNGFVFTHLKLGSVYLKKYYIEADYFLVKSNGGDGLTSLKYLHQLQNLYFALTGEELEIKL